MKVVYATVGICALWTIAGCGKPSIWEAAAAELPKAQADARAAGLPVEPAEFQSEKLADRDNAAPLYLQALSKWDIGSKTRQEDVALWMSAITSPGNSPTLQRSLQRYSDVLSLVRKAAAIKDCRFEQEYSLGLDAPHPEYVAMKDWAKALGAEAVMAAQDGDEPKARQNLIAIQNLARHASTGDSIISQLVCVAISKIGMRSGERVLGEGGRPFAPAIEAMAKAVPEPKTSKTIAFETVAGVATLRNLDLQNPFFNDIKTIVDSAKAANSGLTRDTINKAFITRHLQYWTEVARRAKTLENEKLGAAMDEISASQQSLDATYTINKTETGSIHAQAGNANESLEAKKMAALAASHIVRGGNPAELAKKFNTNYVKTSKGFRAVSKTYHPLREAKAATYEFIYPYLGGS